MSCDLEKTFSKYPPWLPTVTHAVGILFYMKEVFIIILFGGNNQIMLTNGQRLIGTIGEDEELLVKGYGDSVFKLEIKDYGMKQMLRVSLQSQNNQYGTQLVISEFNHKVGDEVKFENSNTVWTVISIEETEEPAYQILCEVPVKINNFQFDSFLGCMLK